MRALLLGATAICALIGPDQAQAQNQIKPYFLVILDDSGSMDWSISGTEGDPIPPGTTSCGTPSTNRRIDHAKCALQRVVGAFGDVEFGLLSFKRYGTGSRLRVPISGDNQAEMISWVDWIDDNPDELDASGTTPIRRALDSARGYYDNDPGPIASDPARGCRPYYVILLHDGSPCCNTANNLANSQAAATRLLDTAVPGGANARIETYVIYFGIEFCADDGDCTEGGCNTMTGICNVKEQADSIAAAGGTGAAQAASNEDQLALAFSNIIADSILTEVCGGGDEDCDTRIDEGFVKYCDRDNIFGGGATSSLDYCTDPGDDCDESDDNCFNGTDDEPLGPCGTCSTPPEICDRVDNNCNGLVDEGNICMGCVPTGAETCDNADNDCDGSIDENLSRSCGSNVGVCVAGIETCSAGMWMGCTATGGDAEICDGIDNDCDGRIDGMTMACGSDVGSCRAGRRICIDGMFGNCIGQVTPVMEICDGLDNNCNGEVDESDPSLGASCGNDTGACMAGSLMCVGGVLQCVGAVGPSDEICNGIDDDCDGLADDGLGVGEACGVDQGLCMPGRNVCVDGMVVCEGEIGPTDELCNNLDDDCDGAIDEMLPMGIACGSEEGLCMLGMLSCIDGREVCAGEVPPSSETCDCEDNDCDGSVDEEGSSPICPEGSACEDCQCALPCVADEFGFECPTGKAPRITGDACFCVADRCQEESCAQETVERDGETLCGDDTGVVCQCKNNECTFPCDGLVCENGLVCSPNEGRCVEDSCRGLGCPDGELCDAVSGECEADPCASTQCADDEACRGGECVGSCATVECGAGESCQDGQCQADRCAGIRCSAGQVCNSTSGACVDNLCAGVRCPAGSLCDPVSGQCVLDPCVGLRCPDRQMCQLGQCIMVATPDAGMDGGVDGGDEPGNGNRVLATGGGGCACSVPGAPVKSANTRVPQGATLFLLLLLGLRVRQRHRLMRPFALAAGLIAALSLGGCEVDPFCLDCTDGGVGDSGVGDGAARDGRPLDVATFLDGADDATQEDAGCEIGRTDDCNDFDDDCDGEVDEDADTANDPSNCGQCGNACAPPGAFGECNDGVCGLDRCDVGFYNIDGDDDNGCEYRCLPTETDDTICDRRDNDCDGEVDEDVDLQTDADNCGQCGRDCRLANATTQCEMGLCVLEACIEGFVDVDGQARNGCEYECTPAAPAIEACNIADDDCDGTVDEGNPDGGAACGSSVGACEPGVEQCFGGALVCMGATRPSTEICNDVDDDCNGVIDDGFLSGDIRNCGSCGNVCSYANGFAECRSGSCALVACEDGFWDANMDTGSFPNNGCEYACEFQGAEACNGIDDDCDGSVDEALAAPANFCNPNGVCASTEATCGGAVGWECNYPSTYQATETRCDSLDNDCNGVIDDPFRSMGLDTSCSNGVGACQRPGTIVCTGDGAGVRCNAPDPADPTAEVCDQEDNDCDGLVDEPRGNPGTNASYVIDPMVHVTHSGNDFYIYQYEAARPDATDTFSGGDVSRACSRRDVLPWVQVSYPEAAAACAAAGLRLCTEAEWEAACVSSSGTCLWAYSSGCDTFSADRCNGNEHDPVPGDPDDDRLMPTRSFNQCYAPHSASAADRIYDMSGNAKEWTQARSAGINPLRGGSFNNPGIGLRCDFDFTVGDDDFQIDNVGFRCCSDTAP